MIDVLMVPGFTGSGPDHWQSIWQRSDSGMRRVSQRDWDHPHAAEWISTIESTIRHASRPLVLVGHSLGSIAIVHWSRLYGSALVRGALLVAPSDTESSAAPEEIRRFGSVPNDKLPFLSIVVASENDEFLHWRRAREFATAWGSEIVSAGSAGHLNTASGHGPWPEGLELLRQLQGRCS